MSQPPLSLVRQLDTHRLVPSKHRDGGASVLDRIADDERHLQDLFDLDHATNDRLWAENGRALALSEQELVASVPGYRIVNAAFCHPHPLGGRFNGPDRGAWYAAFELETAQREIAFHKSIEYAEIGRFDDSVTYDDYLSDFSAHFHDLRGEAGFVAYLSPESYVASQTLAAELLAEGSLGVVYPSVRRPDGTCVACFRPALVANVRRHRAYRFSWHGDCEPRIEVLAGECGEAWTSAG